ncbi:MAG: helix-turn-helix domain-containing protein [Planctomycetota bacterium]
MTQTIATFQNPTPEPYLIDRQAAAKYLGISLATLDRHIRDKAIPSAKLRGRRMFNTETLKRWIRQQEENSQE